MQKRTENYTKYIILTKTKIAIIDSCKATIMKMNDLLFDTLEKE